MNATDDTDDMPRGVTQTIVQGTIGNPSVFSTLLLVCVMLLGACTTALYFVNQNLNRMAIEVRVLQVHVQDTNAILLRAGIVKPGDPIDPTAPRN